MEFIIGELFVIDEGEREVLVGTGLNDTIDTRGGIDLVVGRGGTDTAVLFDESARYDVMTLAGVTHVRSRDTASEQYHNAALVNIDLALIETERLEFLNRSYTLDQGANTSFIIGELFVIDEGEREVLVGTGLNDTIDTRGGIDLVVGRGGTDTAVLFDESARYDVMTLAGVTHVRSRDTASEQYHTAALVNIDLALIETERLEFLNRSYTLDQGANTSFIIGELFVIDEGEREVLVGTGLNDTIDTRGGIDLVVGRGGTDTAVLFDESARYDVMTLAGVTHVRSRDTASEQYHTAALVNIDLALIETERLEFLNRSYTLDQGANTSFIIGELFVIDEGEREVLVGTGLNDTIDTRGGIDLVVGRGGTDTAVLFDESARYDVMTLAGVTHVRSRDTASEQYHTAALVNIDLALIETERLEFLNRSYTLDQGANTSFIIGELFVIDEGEREVLVGTGLNDTIDTRGGGDLVDGRGGTDTVVIFDDSTHYDVMTLEGVTHVRSKDGASEQYHLEGRVNIDTVLINVEFIQFLDKTVDLGESKVTASTSAAAAQKSTSLLLSNFSKSAFNSGLDSDSAVEMNYANEVMQPNLLIIEHLSLPLSRIRLP